MGFNLLTWYCRPMEYDIWAHETGSVFGAYTPCGIDSFVICVSNLVLMVLVLYRIWLITRDAKVQRFRLRSNVYNYMLGFLAAYCTVEPLFRLGTGVSIFNLDDQTGFAPFEAVSLIINVLSWGFMLLMIGLETKIYVKAFRWYIRFGVIYLLVADTVMLTFMISLKNFYPRSVLFLYICTFLCKILLGMLLLVYLPYLDPYPNYIPLSTGSFDDTKYEALLGGEHVCPEREANMFSRIFFGWITPLMQQGYRRPITEKDVWKLDTWDQTETLRTKFLHCWMEESQKEKPWLLRALNRSLGRRFWFGGFFKVFQ